MIISVEISGKIFEATEKTNIAILDLSNFPRPLLKAYHHVQEITEDKGKEAGLYSISFQFIPLFFQYCALLFASDYLNGTIPAEENLSELLEKMIIRPSVGKWRDFSVAYSKRLLSTRTDSCLEVLSTEFLEANKVNGSWHIDAVENNPESKPKRYSLLEFLVILRNRMAHRQGQMNHAGEIFGNAWKVCRALFSALPELAVLRLRYTKENQVLLQKNDISSSLYPMIIQSEHPVSSGDRKKTKKEENVANLLLDEADGKKLFYTDIKHFTEHRNRELPPFSDVERMLASVRVEWPKLKPNDIKPEEWKRRIDVIGMRTLNSILPGVTTGVSLITPQFDPSVYIVPETWKNLADRFMKSPDSVLLLSAPQGSGKSAFLANMQYRNNEIYQDKVLMLIDARRLDKILFPTHLLENHLLDKLRIDGNIHEVFKKMYKEKIVTCLLIDGINEFYKPLGSKTTGNPHVLLQGLLNFAAEIHTTSPGVLKMIITGRNDFFEDPFIARNVIGPVLENYPNKLIYTEGDENNIGLILSPSELDEKELENLYNNIRETLPTHSPLTHWNNLSPTVKMLIRNPLKMRLLMHYYSGKEINPRETEYTLRKRIAERVVSQPDEKACIIEIIEKLKHTPYLDLSSIDPKKDSQLYRVVNDKTEDESTGLPKNKAYQQLIDQGVLREEIWSEGDKRTSRVTPYNELLFNIIELDFRKAITPFLSRFNLLTIIILLIGGISLIGIPMTLINSNFKSIAQSLVGTEELPHLNAFFSIWALLDRVKVLSVALFSSGILMGTILALIIYNFLEKITWELRSRIPIIDVFAYKRTTEFSSKNVKFVLPIYGVFLLIVAIFYNVFAFNNLITMELNIYNGFLLVVGVFIPGLILIYTRQYLYCKRQEPTHGVREILFGRREMLMTILIAIRAIIAVGTIILIIFVSHKASLWFIMNVGGPSIEQEIAKIVKELPSKNPNMEIPEYEIQFIESEKYSKNHKSLRTSAACIVLKEDQNIIMSITRAYLSVVDNHLIKDIQLFYLGAGISIISLLLLLIIVINPLIYWKLENDAKWENIKYIKKL